MAESGTAPRVNKKLLSAYIGRTVALVGAVESHMPTAVVLRASVGFVWTKSCVCGGEGWMVLTEGFPFLPSFLPVQDGGIVNVNPAPGSDYSRCAERLVLYSARVDDKQDLHGRGESQWLG